MTQSQPERRAFRLNMRSPLHISGDTGVGKEGTLDYLPSDTLFSALFVTWLELPSIRAEALALLQAERLPFTITSAFPFAADVLLLPRPLLPIAPEAKEGLTGRLPDKHAPRQQKTTSAKQFKKVRWVSESVFRTFIKGSSRADLSAYWQAAALLPGNIWVTKTEQEQLAQAVAERDEDGRLTLWRTVQMPKVAIDRIMNGSNLFHVGRAHYVGNGGVWFLAEGDVGWLDRIQTALELLADSGIGGQRSRGNGQFILTVSAPPDLGVTPTNPAYTVLLSRAAPRAAEMHLLQQDQASYELVSIGGYCGDLPYLRRRVRMLAEGSIIGYAATSSIGGLVDVKPDSDNPTIQQAHPMWRYGVGYALPIAVAE